MATVFRWACTILCCVCRPCCCKKVRVNCQVRARARDVRGGPLCATIPLQAARGLHQTPSSERSLVTIPSSPGCSGSTTLEHPPPCSPSPPVVVRRRRATRPTRPARQCPPTSAPPREVLRPIPGRRQKVCRPQPARLRCARPAVVAVAVCGRAARSSAVPGCPVPRTVRPSARRQGRLPCRLGLSGAASSRAHRHVLLLCICQQILDQHQNWHHQILFL